MSSRPRREDFQTDVVKHVLEPGHTVVEVAEKPGINKQSLYARLQVKLAGLESSTVYRYRKVCADLRDLVETCSRHRIARLMKSEERRPQRD